MREAPGLTATHVKTLHVALLRSLHNPYAQRMDDFHTEEKDLQTGKGL